MKKLHPLSCELNRIGRKIRLDFRLNQAFVNMISLKVSLTTKNQNFFRMEMSKALNIEHSVDFKYKKLNYRKAIRDAENSQRYVKKEKSFGEFRLVKQRIT